MKKPRQKSERVHGMKHVPKQEKHVVHSFFKHKGRHHREEDFFDEIEEAECFAHRLFEKHVCIKIYDCHGQLIMSLGDCDHDTYA